VEGKFLFSDPVSEYLPEWRHTVRWQRRENGTIELVPLEHPITVRDAAAMMCGLPYCMFPDPNAADPTVQGLGGAFSERIPLYRQENGDWTGTAEGLPAGFHYHDYIVDGTRMCNDLSPIGYGDFRAINYFEIPDADSGFYLLQDVPHGTVRMDYYNSTVTARYRSCFVYTPPGYETHPEKHYPVLYLQHGGGETETGWIWQGKVNYIMDNLIAAGQCQEMILVMNDGYAFLPDASEHPARGAIDLVLAKDCIPFIDQKYRTLPDRRTRAVAGLSMGGISGTGCRPSLSRALCFCRTVQLLFHHQRPL
jgi:hypothetical protein